MWLIFHCSSRLIVLNKSCYLAAVLRTTRILELIIFEVLLPFAVNTNVNYIYELRSFLLFFFRL